MEALLATVVLVAVIVVALIILGRSWPRSSPFGGYRARRGPRAEDPDALTEEHGHADREDDDVRWRWPDDRGSGGAGEG